MLFKIFYFFIFFFFFHSNLHGKDGSAITLIYHRFEDSKYPSTSVSQENFHSQLLYLKENNFNVLPISRLIDFFYNKKPLPDKSIFITIDDAYKSFYVHAFPILKKFDFPFSVFLSTDFVDKKGKNDFMSWEMLREIQKSKGNILNHSHKHESFLKLSLDEVERDILLADEIISSNLGNVEKIISYPYGESNKNVRRLIENLGYKIAFSQHSSPIHFYENKYNLPRFSINDEYGRMKRFKQIVEAKPLTFNFFDILKNNEDDTSLEIKFKTDFDDNNINCFLNDGVLFKDVYQSFIKIRLTQLAKDKRYRINCTILKNTNLYWFGKIIIREDGKFFY